jgi:hypothetical protein
MMADLSILDFLHDWFDLDWIKIHACW